MKAAVLGWLGRAWGYVLARGREGSTWTGLGLIAAAHAKQIPPEVMAALQYWGPWLSGLLIAADTGGGRRDQPQ